MKMFVILATLSLLSCATLDSSRMTERCNGLYNACLDTCPKAPAPQPGQLMDVHYDTAQCVDRCNAQAKQCEHP